jgi:hypothetical protein
MLAENACEHALSARHIGDVFHAVPKLLGDEIRYDVEPRRVAVETVPSHGQALREGLSSLDSGT